MTVDSLYLKCAQFEKLAQAALDVKQTRETIKNINTVLNYLGKNYLQSVPAARRVFDEIAKSNAGQTSPTGLQFKKDLSKFKIHLEYYNEKNLPNRKVERDIYLKNINTLLEAKDFNKYIQVPVKNAYKPATDDIDTPTIELDNPDMGF